MSDQMDPDDLLDPRVRDALQAHGVAAEVLPCDPDLADTAAFCEHYGFAMEQAANTILVASKKVDPTRYAVCVVLGTTRLDVNRKVSELLGVKRLSFADAETTRELTGMMIGGVTAVGVGEALPIYVDGAVMAQPQVVMGGGNRSSKLLLAPAELLKLPGVEVVEGLAQMQETIDVLSDAQALEDIREGDAAYARGDVVRGIDAIRRLKS